MMNAQNPSSSRFPVRFASPSGLAVEINSNGSIRRLSHGNLMLNLFLGSEIEGGPANLFLRRHGAAIDSVPLLGPHSPAVFHWDGQRFAAEGVWQGLRFRVGLRLAEGAAAWFWHVTVENTGPDTATVDLIYAQDLGLAPYAAVRLNEYYVSQYLDHTPLSHPVRGFVVASRQNQAADGRNPWVLVGALNRAVAFATDALQVYGLALRAGTTAPGLGEGLPALRRQHEHALVALQSAPLSLARGAAVTEGFYGWLETHHPAATAPDDLALVDRALALPEAAPAPGVAGGPWSPPPRSLFGQAPRLDARALDEPEIHRLFGQDLREPERDPAGRLLSFFTGPCRHVVLKAKELAVLRPHGQILRSGAGLVPDEAALTSTVWMAGVFHSMVTQGHVSINRFLSTVHGYLGLFRCHGLRVFVELDGSWRLLDLPSAFEMAPQGCRWLYHFDHSLLEVRSEALEEQHELRVSATVLEGPPLRLLWSHHVAIDGDDGSAARPVQWRRDGDGVWIWPRLDSDLGRRFPAGGFRLDPLPGTVVERVGGDELLFVDGQSRDQPFLCLRTAPASAAGFRLQGRLVTAAGPSAGPREREVAGTLRLQPPASSPWAGEVARLGEMLPWLTHDALVHYLAPRGLEQYSGGGWGTRDVTQGPMELLLALGRCEPMRDLLLRVFAQQNPDGDWPQWFMFFDRERTIRAADSHGDIVFWPILALGQYLLASEDAALLDLPVPFYHPDGPAPAATVFEHVERALAVIAARMIPGTRLVAYGHGDWNDSLQPVDPAMRERLCSAWTVTLHYQTLATLAAAMRRIGRHCLAGGLETMAQAVAAEFQRLLLVDGILAGFAHLEDEARISYLLHPRDRTTGLSYSLLPMVHAIIADLFTPEQAAHHLALIRAHLTGPDGARLFDRPMAYRGGLQRHFQRIESSAFFGREIGLMYTHAHLRYAEALARFGAAEEFLRALCLVNPVGLGHRVPAAALRQANCYYSSSDAAFADRYQAYAEYHRVQDGTVALEGGWRVYSSGAGITVSLIIRRFLGLRQEGSVLAVDPVIPPALDGLQADWELAGTPLRVEYRVGARGFGPERLTLDGEELPFVRGANPYRPGAAEVPMAMVKERLAAGARRLVVHLP